MVKEWSKVRYALWLKNHLVKLKFKTSSSELKESYERETKQKITKQAAARTLRNIAGSQVRRFEQLYWLPYEKNEPSRNGIVSIEPSQPLHSSHNYRFSIAYRGEQPKDGLVRAWGRNRSQIQVEYIFKDGMKLQVFKNRIIIMLHNPKGETTIDQLREARNLAFFTIMNFCKERNLYIPEGEYLEKKIYSHHVLESEKINKTIQTAIGQYAPEIEKRTGSLIYGDNTHRNKIEHEGGGTSNLKGEDAAKKFEYLLWQFPEQFAHLAGALKDYNENLKLHLDVQRAQLTTMQELEKLIKRWNNGNRA